MPLFRKFSLMAVSFLYLTGCSNPLGEEVIPPDNFQPGLESASSPSNLTFSNSPFIWTRSVSIVNQVPSALGGAITSCSSNPTLPAGIILSNQCVLSGAGAALQSAADYVITAANSAGTADATIQISIVDVVPSVSYSASSFSFLRNQTISTITPSNSGGAVVSCVSVPSLPAGLSLSNTCAISGTPTTVQASAQYAITATNSGGSQSAITLSIDVFQNLTGFTETFQFSTTQTDYSISTSTLEYLTPGLRHKLLTVDQENSALGFSGAVSNSDLVWNSTDSVMQLSPVGLAAKTGSLESRIFSAPAPTNWTELAWNSRVPAGKALPNNKITETAFAVDNISMANNELLLHFDESVWNQTVGEVIDSSGNGLNGSITAGVTQANAGKFGKGATFPDSLNQFITIPHSDSLDSSANMSWEAWIYPTNVDGNPRPIISKRQTSAAGNNAYSMFIFTGGKMTIDIAGSAVGSQRFDTGYVFAVNTWYHVAATFEGALGSNRLKFYVNGALVSQHQPTASSIPATNALAPFRVGSLVGNDNTFRGRIDEVAVYSRVLSLPEITSRFNRGSRRIKFQARHCVNSDCSDGVFVGPDNTAASFFTENNNTGNTRSTVHNVASLFTNRQFFQYKAILESENSVLNPQLSSVSLQPSLYDPAYPVVINNTPFSFVTLSSFVPSTAGSGQVRYQISRDGTNWFYWNSGWTGATLGFSHSSSAGDINSNISTFPASVGEGNFYFKAIFDSGASSTAPATLNSISVTGAR